MFVGNDPGCSPGAGARDAGRLLTASEHQEVGIEGLQETLIPTSPSLLPNLAQISPQSTTCLKIWCCKGWGGQIISSSLEESNSILSRFVGFFGYLYIAISYMLPSVCGGDLNAVGVGAGVGVVCWLSAKVQ